jgi:hypothetical protein
MRPFHHASALGLMIPMFLEHPLWQTPDDRRGNEASSD